MSPARHPLFAWLPPSLRPDRSHEGAASDRLAEILGMSRSELGSIRIGPRFFYRPFSIPKANGGERRLLAPSPRLKRLQRRLLQAYLTKLPPHPCATAFHPGGSTVQHVRPHADGRLIACVDLRDFFESTSAARVRRFWLSEGWHEGDLRILMALTTFQGRLPQGAPSSPALSNLVNRRLDERLDRLARLSEAVYTRYGDDLTFSWREGTMPGSFTKKVEELLSHEGYRVQPAKGWRVEPTRGRPVVAGIVLAGDGRLRVPWRTRVRTAWLRWRCRWTGDPRDHARWRGYAGYVRMVEKAAGPNGRG